VPALPRSNGEMNCHAARKQTDSGENRHPEYVFRFWSSEAFARIEEVRHYENREHRRLGGDQTEHSDAAPGHSYLQSGSSGCLISHSGRRLRTTGRAAKLYSGGGDAVDHSSVQASHGSLPARGPTRYERTRFVANTAKRMPPTIT